MRSIAILLLFVCLTGACAAPVSRNNSTATNSAEISINSSVYVYGQVQKPGRYDWFSGMTVVDAITAAGGLKQSNGHYTRITRNEDCLVASREDDALGLAKRRYRCRKWRTHQELNLKPSDP